MADATRKRGQPTVSEQFAPTLQCNAAGKSSNSIRTRGARTVLPPERLTRISRWTRAKDRTPNFSVTGNCRHPGLWLGAAAVLRLDPLGDGDGGDICADASTA